MSNAHWQNSREIVKRIVVEGKLVLETPARLGNGDADGLTDMPLYLDPLEGKALLTGASIAGALRSYLRERQLGYGQKGNDQNLYAQLFGGVRPEDEEIDARANLSKLSPLMVSDALGDRPEIELRDGVQLDPETRTAKDEKKFDMELLAAGTTFPLRFELLMTKNDEATLLQALVIGLQGFEKGEIAMGGRKRRGLGRGKVEQWSIREYDLTTTTGLLDWLDGAGTPHLGSEIATLLGIRSEKLVDHRQRFIIEATFALETSLLIRSGSGEAGSPDTVHLHSRRKHGEVPILSGTSLTGALRARAVRIANTLGLPMVPLPGQNKDDDEEVPEIIIHLFGGEIKAAKGKTHLKASRLIGHEAEIQDGITNLVQNRVKIDRFTGGSFPTALFNQQPVFGKYGWKTTVTLNLELQKNSDTFEAQIGLLLLLLKDLWMGDLPLGGESSVGRGRLQGICATLKLNDEEWKLSQNNGEPFSIEKGDVTRLEHFVQALQEVAV